MRTIGLIGGMSWESSAVYYRLINEAIRQRVGGLHSAECVMYSVDFAGIEELQRTGGWDLAAERLSDVACKVEAAGADFVLLCTNTMHRVADQVAASIRVPLLHIADATAAVINARGLKRVGLLGTRYTMEQDFYRGRLESRHGIEVLVPALEDRDLINDVIYSELVVGRIIESSRRVYLRAIDRLVDSGAEGIILGCTEIDLLISQEDVPVPVFDTTRIHAEHAVELALRDGF